MVPPTGHRGRRFLETALLGEIVLRGEVLILIEGEPLLVMLSPDFDTALTIPLKCRLLGVELAGQHPELCTASIGTRACELVPPPVRPSLLSDPSIVVCCFSRPVRRR